MGETYQPAACSRSSGKGSVWSVLHHLLGPESTVCIETKLIRFISGMQLAAKPSVDVVGSRAAGQAQNTRCRHRVLKERRLYNPRRELIFACEDSSTTGVILLRFFAEALGGLESCRNGRRTCRIHGVHGANSYTHKHTHTHTHKHTITQTD